MTNKEIVLQKYPKAKVCQDDYDHIVIVAPGIILSDSFYYEHEDKAWANAAYNIEIREENGIE